MVNKKSKINKTPTIQTRSQTYLKNTQFESKQKIVSISNSTKRYQTRFQQLKKQSETSSIPQNSDSKESETIPSKRVHNESKNNRIVKSINYVRLNKYDINSIVLAKQKYSLPWPAKIEKIEKNRVLVHFCGDKRQGYVDSNEIYDFIKSIDSIKHVLKSKKVIRSYKTGLKEAELLLNIPNGISLFE